MTESLHIQPCPVCASTLTATFDSLEGKLTLRPENLPPLAKDTLAVCARYKQLKGLGAAWEKLHGARGIIYAQSLLEAVGSHGGQLERALGLLEWLAAGKRDYDLSTAATYFNEFQAAVSKAVEKGRCRVCGESFYGVGELCERHK